ncbi:MAG TPA: hypothetical protein VK660_04750, partial [Xanthomonadaceae bacterium]|nr:hypothetical protein [Xanthomonadaceae bacterium]
MPSAGSPLAAAVRILGEIAEFEVVMPRALDPELSAVEALRAIERCSHFRTRRVMLQGQWWKRDCGPILAFKIVDGAPLALLSEPPEGYLQIDPSTGEQVRMDDRAATAIQPFGYVFYRPFPDQVHRALDVLRFSARGMGRDTKVLVVTAIAGALLGMCTPIATMALIDTAIPDASRSLLFQMGLGLVGAAVGKALLDLIEAVVTTRITMSMTAVTQAAVWDRLLKLRPSFIRQYST